MRRLWWAAVVAALVWLPGAARAEVKLPHLFSDGMVLQQGDKCPVWGTAEPGEAIDVLLVAMVSNDLVKSAGAKATADKDGKWRADLGHLGKHVPAGGPYTLTVSGKDSKRTIKDVFVGEVWVCSGQSNMEMRLDKCFEAKKDIENSKNPKLRLFTVKKTAKDEPQSDVPYEEKSKSGMWLECNPENVPGFSGVAFYFGRDLQKALDVPVGLIHTSWGGTASEQWTSKKVLDANPEHKGHHKGQTQLYNGMIAPLLPYKIKGAIWYQGESNAGRAELYRTGFPLMIKNWRDDFEQGDFPFLFVQLAPYAKAGGDWPRLREAQLNTMLTVKNTAMAVITDVGEENDIHPKKKEPVGARLALAARALAYGETIEYSGPIYKGVKFDGNQAFLSFTHLGKGLTIKGEGGELKGFTVAGDDKVFHPAKAEIKGDLVVVTSDKVSDPRAVRFGWENFPANNFYNKDGLPASPFRTDDYPAANPKPKDK